MIVNTILGIIDKFIPDKDKQADIKKALIQQESDLEKAMIEYSKQDHELRIKEIEHTGFKASWRPYIMFSLSTIMVLYLFVYYIIPQLIVIFNIDVYYLQPIDMPEIVWKVFAFCILGVAGLRSIDKWRR